MPSQEILESHEPKIPHPPAEFVTEDRIAQVMMALTRRKMQEVLGRSFSGTHNEMRKELGLTKAEGRAAVLYYIKLARIACNEIFDKLEARYAKQQDEA
jgi:hypothetical protein